METNNGTSYENENQNKKIEELTDEQMKEVAGGGWALIGMVCEPPTSNGDDGCLNFDMSTCKCTQCKEGWVLRKQSGQWRCVPQ